MTRSTKAETATSPAEDSESERAVRRTTIYVYGFQLLGLLMIFPALFGLALNYGRRAAVQNTFCASHFDWQIRTGWWMVGWWSISAALMLASFLGASAIIGMAGALVLWFSMLWLMYRLLRGYIKLSKGQPMPDRRRSVTTG